jgi:protease-4
MNDERRSRTLLWVLVGGAAFFLFVLAVFTLVYFTVRNQPGEVGEYTVTGSGGKIGVVDIEGVILDPETPVKQLKKFADDDSIKAIVLHLNTPGGGAAASEEIYKEVRRIRDEKKKRIVASIETVGASGGYYIASGTNKIYADQASIVGSIGTIMEWYNYGDLVRWAKVHEIIIKTGEFKDTGDPMRDLTPRERDYLQGMANNMLGQFIKAVANGRSLKEGDVRTIADGRVWTGEQALAMKLIDQVADFQSAVRDTAKTVGIKGEPALVKIERQRPSLFDLVFGDSNDVSSWIPDRAKLMQKNPGFYFLWR